MTAPLTTNEDYARRFGRWWGPNGPVDDPLPPPPVPPTEPPGTASSYVDICFYTAQPDTVAADHGAVPAAATAFLPRTERIIPLDNATFARATVTVTTALAGAKLAFRYWDGAAFSPLGEGGVECYVGLDTANVATAGASVAVAAAAKLDARVQMFRLDGDDATALLFGECALQLWNGPQVEPIPPGPCENIINVDFSIFTGATPQLRWADAVSQGYSLTDPDGVVVDIGIVNSPALSPQTAALWLQIAGGGGTSTFSVQKDFTVPDGNYSVRGAVRPENVAGSLTGAPENQWTTATLPQSSVGTTLTLSPTGQGTVTGSPTGDLYYAGPSVAPVCDGGPPPGTTPPPATATGGVFGIFTVAGDGDVLPPWNSGILTVSPGTIVAQLTQIRANGQKAFIQLSGQGQGGPLFSGGQFSESRYNTVIDGYTGIDLTTFSDVLLGVYLIDEFRLASRWGMVIPDAVIERLAGRVLATITGVPIVAVRMSATQMEENGFPWSNVGMCWCQFVANRGPIQTYISQNRASATRQGLRIMWGLNILNGGDGSSNIVGTGEEGLASNWEMTATEVTTYGNAMVAAITAGGGDGIFCWRYRSSFLGRTGMSAALTALGNSVP